MLSYGNVAHFPRPLAVTLHLAVTIEAQRHPRFGSVQIRPTPRLVVYLVRRDVTANLASWMLGEKLDPQLGVNVKLCLQLLADLVQSFERLQRLP